MSRYWKVKLTSHAGSPIDGEMRTCEETETMDEAIRQARRGAGLAFQSNASAQVFSDLEMTDPLEAERIFLDTGDFNAYLRVMSA